MRSWTRRLRDPWALAFGAMLFLVLFRNLVGLQSSPPGMYIDEASIGYNAWSLAHFGVDEHGHSFPLFFQAFGEYKNPVYIYVLVPFVRVFGLSAAVVRTPAALLGLATCVALSATLWRVTHSRWTTLLALLIAGLTPWLTDESRVGFEVISMVALVALAVWCISHSDRGPQWFLYTGIALALVVYSYTSGRIEAAILTGAIAIAYGMQRRRGWWLVIPPVVLSYGALLAWNFANPGALTARFGTISIVSGATGFADIVHSFVSNYIAQLGFPFLFTHGDANLRHHTGFGGMLLVGTFPFVIAGLVYCARNWRDPFHLVCIIGVVTGPLPAAVTQDGIPHSLRAAAMLPFLIVVSVLGAQELSNIFDRFGASRKLLIALSVLVIVEGAAFTFDQFHDYPQRAVGSFDTGVQQAVAVAQQHADGHRILLSGYLNQAYIEAFAVTPPRPPDQPTNDNDHEFGLAQLDMRVVDPSRVNPSNSEGDILVLGPDTPEPLGGQVLYKLSDVHGSTLAVAVQIGP